MSDPNEYTEFEGMGLMDLIKSMNEVKVELELAKAVSTRLQKKYDALRLGLIPASMDEDGINTITVEDIGRVSLTSDIYASIPAAQRDGAWDWLRDHSHGDVIKETVNAGTLKALLKGIMRKGDPDEQPPEELFKITPYSRASITKA